MNTLQQLEMLKQIRKYNPDEQSAILENVSLSLSLFAPVCLVQFVTCFMRYGALDKLGFSDGFLQFCPDAAAQTAGECWFW